MRSTNEKNAQASTDRHPPEATLNHTDSDRAARYRSAGWWPDQPLLERYRAVIRDASDGLAVVDDAGRSLTHAGLLDAGHEMARALADAGVGERDIVVVAMPNRVAWQVVFVALLELAAVPMTIPVTTDADTIAYLVDLVGARAIVVAAQRGDAETSALGWDAASRAASPVAAISVRDDLGLDVRTTPGTERQPARAPAELDHVMTTSSTTGLPKAVMHTANTLAALNITFAERFGLDASSPILMASPLGHSVGAIHGARLALHTGAPLVLLDRWEPTRALALATEHRCAFTAAATPFLKDLVDAPAARDAPKLATLRWFLCGGAPVPPSLMDAAEAQFPQTEITVLWGMTEGGLTTSTAQTPRDVRRVSAGIGLPGLELAIVNPDGARLATGASGELVMRGPGVFVGYLGQEDLYRGSLTPEGFFRTGDLAQLDEAGYVRLTGRLKDLIIRGGVNISPVPLEDALAGHPAVRSAAVVGYPDERLGERICAVVVPQDGAEPSFDELIAWLEQSGLPRRLWPERLELVPAMPQTAAGKIRKVELRRSLFGAG